MMPGRTLQIRMTPELTARLDAVATGLNIRPATLGRAALVAWLDSIEQDGIQLQSRTMFMKRYRAAQGSANDNR